MLVDEAGQRPKNEIAGPAARLQDPEGAVLALEKRAVEPNPLGDGGRGGPDHRPIAGHLTLSFDCCAIGRHRPPRYKQAILPLRAAAGSGNPFRYRRHG